MLNACKCLSSTEKWHNFLRNYASAQDFIITKAGTQTLLISVEYPEAQMTGPPFPLDRKTIDELYATHHSIELLGSHEIIDLEPRLRARGLSELREVAYKLTRL